MKNQKLLIPILIIEILVLAGIIIYYSTGAFQKPTDQQQVAQTAPEEKGNQITVNASATILPNTQLTAANPATAGQPSAVTPQATGESAKTGSVCVPNSKQLTTCTKVGAIMSRTCNPDGSAWNTWDPPACPGTPESAGPISPTMEPVSNFVPENAVITLKAPVEGQQLTAGKTFQLWGTVENSECNIDYNSAGPAVKIPDGCTILWKIDGNPVPEPDKFIFPPTFEGPHKIGFDVRKGDKLLGDPGVYIMVEPQASGYSPNTSSTGAPLTSQVQQ